MCVLLFAQPLRFVAAEPEPEAIDRWGCEGLEILLLASLRSAHEGVAGAASPAFVRVVGAFDDALTSAGFTVVREAEDAKTDRRIPTASIEVLVLLQERGGEEGATWAALASVTQTFSLPSPFGMGSTQQMGRGRSAAEATERALDGWLRVQDPHVVRTVEQFAKAYCPAAAAWEVGVDRADRRLRIENRIPAADRPEGMDAALEDFRQRWVEPAAPMTIERSGIQPRTRSAAVRDLHEAVLVMHGWDDRFAVGALEDGVVVLSR